MRENARSLLKRAGMEGGAMIDHAYRFTKGLERARFAPHFHALGTGFIDYNRCADIHREAKELGFFIEPRVRRGPSPAWLSPGALVPNYDVSVVRHAKNGTLWTPGDVRKLARYLLSHASFVINDPLADEPDRSESAVRWFGIYGYNNYKAPRPESMLTHTEDLRSGIVRALNQAPGKKYDYEIYEVHPGDTLNRPGQGGPRRDGRQRPKGRRSYRRGRF